MFKAFLFVLKDVALLFIALSLALYSRSMLGGSQLEFDRYAFFTHVVVFIPIICISIVFYLIYGLYDRHVLSKRRKLVQHILMVGVGTFVTGILWFYLFPLDFGLKPKSILLLYVIYSALTASLPRYKYLFFGKDGKRGAPAAFNLACIGGSHEMKEFYSQLKEHTYNGYNTLYLIEPRECPTDTHLDRLQDKLITDKVQYIVLDTKDDHAVQIGRRLYSLVFKGVKFLSFQDMYERMYDKENLSYVDEEWFMTHITGKNDHVYMILKRAMDLLISVPLMILSLIIYPFVYVAIKLEDKGPLFARMDRIGQNNKIIRIIKFRSMRGVDDGTWVLKEEGQGAEDKKNEGRQMRVTKIGKFIRKTRIDELPQLWNVVKGDLSLIGPRPEMPKIAEHYEKEIPFYSARHTIRPGLSGWAQIHHDIPPHSVEGTKEKLSYDLYYLKHRSIFLDLLIALRTVQTLLSAVGV